MHIEGSLEPELIFALARRNGVALPYADVEALRRAYVQQPAELPDVYHAGTTVLRTSRTFRHGAAYFVRA